MAKRKLRLDDILMARGLFDEPKTARGWIMAGKVVVDGAVVATPGTAVGLEAEIHVRGLNLKFASRGGYKLEHALLRFDINVAGKAALDAGAASGGFTDCLLQAGAVHVTAVEVGFGQLKGKLASDPRVLSLERTNIGDLRKTDLDPPIALAACDLSYLTLVKAVPMLAALFAGDFDIVALIKPLYEGLSQGDIANVDAYAVCLSELFVHLAEAGFPPAQVCASPLLGARGATEFLARFRTGRGLEPGQAAQRALDDLRAHPPKEIDAFVRAR